jgi:hypothetical protein
MVMKKNLSLTLILIGILIVACQSIQIRGIVLSTEEKAPSQGILYPPAENPPKTIDPLNDIETKIIVTSIGICGSLIIAFISVGIWIWKRYSKRQKKIDLALIKGETNGLLFSEFTQRLEHCDTRFNILLERIDKLEQHVWVIEQRFIPLDEALHKATTGEIPTEKYIESQEFFSWEKWTKKGTEEGFFELLEFGKIGLSMAMVKLLKFELHRLEDLSRVKGELSNEEKNYHGKLLKLLTI